MKVWLAAPTCTAHLHSPFTSPPTGRAVATAATTAAAYTTTTTTTTTTATTTDNPMQAGMRLLET